MAHVGYDVAGVPIYMNPSTGPSYFYHEYRHRYERLR
jgi:hypothetical protein